jgi:acid phosphatase
MEGGRFPAALFVLGSANLNAVRQRCKAMKTRIDLHRLLFSLACAGLGACASRPVASDRPDLGVLWVRDAAEYRALSLQAYRAASADLHRLIDDTAWSALPEQTAAEDLRPAIVFDVDETLVSNVDFQVAFEPPFSNKKLNDWTAASKARPVPGAADFIRKARAAGVEIFFVTNRPCEVEPDTVDPCPQQQVTIDDLVETGIPADAEHVMMAGEQPDWKDEKKVRRDLIAKNYRVIMLVGDDLGDFIPCVRARIHAPCMAAATRAGRLEQTDEHAAYWGNGWYIVPNPMHGSWTTVE